MKTQEAFCLHKLARTQQLSRKELKYLQNLSSSTAEGEPQALSPSLLTHKEMLQKLNSVKLL